MRPAREGTMTRETEVDVLGRPAFEHLEPRWLLAAAYPTAYDQYMVELINWARANPTAAATRYGVDLNEGLSAGTIPTAAKQPLAINPYLTNSSQTHSQWMINTGTFSHSGSGGSTPYSRMVAAGYSFGTTYGYGENIAYTNTTGTTTAAIDYLDQLLFVDAGIAGRGHRLNLMDPGFREIGVGAVRDLWAGQDSVVVTQDFAFTAGNPFLTGVIYDDTLVTANSFYTPGEGLGNVQVSAYSRNTGYTYITSTYASGGYSLNLPAGVYDIVVSGGGLGSTQLAQGITISSKNVKLDFTGQTGTPWTLVAPYGGLTTAVIDVDVDPANSQHILLSTRAGIYKTADGGAHWTLIQAGLVRQLAFDPNTSGTVYAVMGDTVGGVLKSTDNGDTWTLKISGITNRDLAVLAIASATPGVLYVGDYSGGGVWRSANGGDTWTRVLNGNTALGVSGVIYVTGLQVSSDGQSVFALLSPTYYNAGYLLKSFNGGSSWVGVSTAVNGQETALAVDPTNSQNVYLGSLSGFYRSSDGGATWSAANTGLPSSSAIYAIAIDPQNPFRIYVGIGNTVYYTSTWGDSWQQLGASTTTRTDDLVWTLAVDPTHPLVIYAAVSRTPLPNTRGEEEGVYKFTRTAPAGPDISITYSGGTILDGQVAPINFGNVNFGAFGPQITFTIRNNGDEPLILSSTTFPAMDHFTATDITYKYLRPGTTATFTLTLKTTAGGTFTQAIAIGSNDIDASPFNFTVTGTVTQADLTGAFPSWATSHSAVPGDTIQVPLVLTNSGNGPASGSIRVALYASTDPDFGTSVSMGTPTLVTLSLSAGQSTTCNLSAVIPGTMAPGSYYLRAVIDSGNTLAESDETNNLATSAGTKSVLWRCGTFGGRRSGSLVLTNDLGQTVTFSQTGGGYCDVLDTPDGYVLEYSGTTAQTTIRITGGAITLAGVIVHGSLGNFIAPTADLVGDLAIEGSLGSIQLRNVTGATLSITAADPTRVATKMTFGRVIDSSLTTNQPIAVLIATDWISVDPSVETITAPSIGSLFLGTAAGATGSLQADLWLTGSSSGSTLGTAAIAGSLTGHWDITGAVDTVTVNGATDLWNWGADSGSLVTTSIGSLALGSVGTARITTTGTIGPVSAVRWLDGQIQALRGSTIKITGAAGVSGDFGADILLTDDTEVGATRLLSTFSVAGWISDSTVRSSGPLGTISCTGITGSALYVGLPGDTEALPANAADFASFTNLSGQPIYGIKSFTVRGVTGSTARYFADSYVSAWSMGYVSLKNVDDTNTDPDHAGEPMGISAHTIDTYTRNGLWLKNLTTAGSADTSGDFVVEII
jgi:uncharacterized protein YkwD